MNWRKIETITKGIGSHRRLAIMEIIHGKAELSVEEISSALKISLANSSGHTNKLVASGLVMKRHDGNFVRHKLTNRGEKVLKFLKTLE